METGPILFHLPLTTAVATGGLDHGYRVHAPSVRHFTPLLKALLLESLQPAEYHPEAKETACKLRFGDGKPFAVTLGHASDPPDEALERVLIAELGRRSMAVKAQEDAERDRPMVAAREAVFAAMFRCCDGCGASVWLPDEGVWRARSHLEKYPQDTVMRDRLAASQQGFRVPASALGRPGTGYLLCTGRGRKPKAECYRDAPGKVQACVACGRRGQKLAGSWPMPCRECIEYVVQGQERARQQAAAGDVRPVKVVAEIYGVYVSNTHVRPELPKVVAALIDAFGAVRTSAAPVEHVRHSPVPVEQDDAQAQREAPVWLLNASQRDAVAGLVRWLNTAVPRVMAEQYEAGTQLVGRVIRGEIGFDALNDQVAAEVKRRQASADRAEGTR